MEGSCVVIHAHSPAMPYHQHGWANTLGQAVRSIKSHDKWQLKGRPGEKKGFYTTSTMTVFYIIGRINREGYIL